MGNHRNPSQLNLIELWVVTMLGAEKQAETLGSTLDLNLDYLEPIVDEKLKQHVTAGGFRLFDIKTKVSDVTN